MMTETHSRLRMDRRAFLLAGLGAVTRVAAQETRLDTLRDWLRASGSVRDAALQACLDVIRSRESEIRAWVQVQPQQPQGRGLLQGIPFGVKDVIETKGLATEYGSPVYKGRIGTVDAAIVRDLRRRGGILMGKTHTTAFAYRTAGPTRNPRDLARTPGGSSSGSAAAVAAGMVPFALGTQTSGSTLRPASYCGVTGFKTSYGLLSLEGVLPLAGSLDTLGFFTHTAEDMLSLWEAMGRDTGRDEELVLGATEPVPEVEPAMATAFQNALTRLRSAGVSVRSIDMAGMLTKLYDAQRIVMRYEGARLHEQRFREHGDRLDSFADLVRNGLAIAESGYRDAMRYIVDSRSKVAELYKTTPVILVPAAAGPAPLGLEFTGESRINAPWTALGTPAISIPMPVGRELPLGLQLTADRGQDARVLRTAVRVQRLLTT